HIDCGLERRGWIQAARSRRGVAKLARRLREWRGRGADVGWLERAEAERLLGTSRYRAAWIDRRAGVVQPLAYVRGLAAAATKLGADVRTGVRVTALHRRDGAWGVETDHGVAHAACVVLATNVRTGDVEGEGVAAAARSFVPAYSVQIATEPLPASLRATLLPERHCASDASHLHLRYFRYDADGRFLMGGPGWLRAPHDADAGVFRRLERSTRAMFPQLDGIAFVHHWAARDGFTADLLPHILEPAPGVLCAPGCNGRGLAIGTVLGELLARRAGGEPASAMPFPTTDPGAVPAGIGSAARLYARVAMQRLRRRLRA
ncbi:MAG TPA: FAD-dependent oxidoreductase, partial [Xanthomonadales bacterium]|nr:FAD-dependent oxidoreductase [Xanthomonadales bacterium]